PAGTVTLPGVTTCPSELPLRRTNAPPAGAGDVSVTVPVVVPSPRIVSDASVSEERLGGGARPPGGTKVRPPDGAGQAPGAVVTGAGPGPGAVGTPTGGPAPPPGMRTATGNEMKSLSLSPSPPSPPPGGAGLSSVPLPTVGFPPITASSPSAIPQRIGNR